MFRPARLMSALGVLVAVLLVVPLVGGCATQQPTQPTQAPQATQAPAAATQAPKPAATQAPKPAATEAPKEAADVVTIMMAQEPDTLFPAIGSMMAKTEVLGAIFTDCVMRNDKNEYIGWGCEQSPNIDNGGAKFVGEGTDKHLEVTYKIKDGWKWQDGTPVTSQDFKFSVELMQNPDFNAQQRDSAAKIAEVLTPDDKTFVLQYMSEAQAHQAAAEGWKYDNAEFYQGFENQEGPVLDPYFHIIDIAIDHPMPAHILSKIDPKDMEKSDYARNPVGNGPYKLKEWVPAQTLVLEAADNGIFKPQIQTVVFKLVPDATAILNGLAAGEAQVSTQIGLDVDQSPELDKLAQEGKIKPYYIPASAWEHIDFNLENPILQDKTVRQAIAYAVDRKSIVDKLMYGKSVVMHSWIAPPNWAIDDSAIIKYDYNPEKAKELLAQAGWTPGADGILEKDGVKFKVKLQTTTAKIRTLITPIVQANLKDVGIAVEPEHLPGRGLFETNGPLMTHTYEMGLYTWISDPDPSPNELYLGKNCPDGANYPCFKNDEFDKLGLQQASELSQTKRKAIISQMLKIWTDELPSLPLFQRLNVSAASPKLENFKPTPSQTPETWNIHEWFLPAS